MLRRCFLRSLAAAPAAGLVNVPLLLTREAMAQQRGGMPQPDPFKPTDAANSPMGVAKGIHPGRVIWVQNAKATSWDGTTGHWWDDANTDQKVVHGMTSKMLQDLTGQKNDKQAWDALFRSFNETRKLGNSGYRPGEKIAIKINCNQDRAPEWGAPQVMPAGGPRGGGPPSAARGGGDRGGGPPAGAQGGGTPRPLNGLPSPHAVVALVTELIEAGGVRGEDIILYDVTGGRNVGKPISDRIRANTNKQFQAVKFLVGTDFDEGGRLSATPDMANPIQFSKADVPVGYLAEQVNAAKYLINMALLRPHGMAGVTLIGKNHFGSVYFPNEGGGWSPRTLHNSVLRTQAVGSYNALVDLMGHRQLGGKTMLYMLDGLYSAEQNEGNVIKWASFNDHWASSLMMSQDPVAIDSVGIDVLRNEPNATQVRGNVDNYLHEAAQANKPPSGTVYNPDKSGVLASLGVHEHWNNPTDRKYSRNLGRKQGIDLIVAG